jgi:hypothetical protein
MSKLQKIILLVTVLAFPLFLVACGASNSNITPTPNSDTVRTAAAATVNARLTEMGPRTAVPTTTPYITRTLSPEQTSTPTSLAELITPLPGTATNSASPDVAEWISQTPSDYSTLAPGTPFKMTWTVKNVGKSTWTTSYQMRFFANNPLGGPAAVNLSRNVLPNETIDITIDLVAPANSGDYHSIWVLTSDKTGNFYPVDVWIKVSSAPPAAETATVPVTPTFTTTPVP